MAEKVNTALVCYTQATFEKLEPDDPDLEYGLDENNSTALKIPELAGSMVQALKEAGVETDLVKVPQRSFEPRDVTKAAFRWRLMDLKESNGRAIDLVICLDFPAWSLTHPQKVCWLNELPYFVTRRATSTTPKTGSGNGQSLELGSSISSLLQAERRGLSEAWRVMAGSRTVAEELARSGLQVEFNPFPQVDCSPRSAEWQAAINRVLAGKK